MNIQLICQPRCANEHAAREALRSALRQNGITADVEEVTGAYPSPTVLIDGVDVMLREPLTLQELAAAGAVCRLDLPTEIAINEALRQFTTDELAGLRLGRPQRLAALDPGMRQLYQALLRGFATFGRVLSPHELTSCAADAGVVLADALRLLDRADLIALAPSGEFRAVYPFSPVPTDHTVTLLDGPCVYSMCAVDALGIPFMLGVSAIVASSDPVTREPVRVSVDVAQGTALWYPAEAVVVYAVTGDCGSSADMCCDTVNFFTSEANARGWLAGNAPQLGHILTQARAVEVGRAIFGSLLE